MTHALITGVPITSQRKALASGAHLIRPAGEARCVLSPARLRAIGRCRLMASGEIHVQLAVNYGEDPKLRALARFGRDARGCRDLYVQMVCYCKRNLTDGFVQAEEVGVLVYPDSPKIGKRDADRLVEVDLAKSVDGGYLLPGFLKRNKSKAEVEAISAAKAESGRRGGKRSGEVRRAEAKPKQGASRDGNQSAPGNEANGKQGASVCLNTETEVIGHRTEVPPTAGAAEPQPPNPGPIVAAYVEGAVAAGMPSPSASLKARVGKQARVLIAEGKTGTDALLAAARNMGAVGWNDLAVQVQRDAAAASGKPSSSGYQPFLNPTDPLAYEGTT